MGQIDSMLLSMEEYTKNANQVKDLVLEQLVRDGVITEQTALDYAEQWQVIVVKPSWFERWAKKFNKSETGYTYKFVKF